MKILYLPYMRIGLALRPALAGAVLCYGITAGLSWRCVIAQDHGLYAQASAEEESSDSTSATQRLGQTKDSYFAEYGFENFNRDMLQVRYQAPKKSYADYCSGFWYTVADLKAIDDWHNRASQSVIQLARDTRKTQSQLDMAIANLKAERGRKIDAYLHSKGFKRRSAAVIEADVPGMVARSVQPLRSVALALEGIAAQKDYDSETLIAAAAAMVQTALHYKIPPNLENGLHTGGILPPVMAMVKGWGDCDTKTGVLASILSNWPKIRMVGIAVQEHYLLGVLRLPGQGDAFVEYQGQSYVLIEPAGPARLPPGTVGVDTMPMLQAAEGFRIEPFNAKPG